MLPENAAAYAKAAFQSFYTDASQIKELMFTLLGEVDGLTLLEPSAGRGAFLQGLRGIPERIDAVDIDERHVAHLKEFPANVNPIHADFVDLFVSGDSEANRVVANNYDGVICNPPYGLRFSVDYRRRIKREFPEAYARESYGLFMRFAIESLRDGGRYVFIVPDTFLTSRNHRTLREFLLREGRPSHLIRFPSQLFETVNFGYGHLCIIAGNRGAITDGDRLIWSEVLDTSQSLSRSLEQGESFSAEVLVERSEHGWVHPTHLEAVAFRRETVQLGEVAECRTGIYTGDNLRFCGFDAACPPNRIANGHPIDWASCVRMDSLSDREKREGIEGDDKSYVPFIRGGHRKPLEFTRWALNWSTSAVQAYRTDKKARLQNQQFYFREGLAIPMVTSGRISASLISEAVFDQGVVGVFPHDMNLVHFLLIYLNSDRVSERLKAVISPGANNSANYIKRIPVVKPTAEELAQASRIVDRAREKGWDATADERESLVASLVA